MKKQPLNENDFNRLAADYVQRKLEIQQALECLAPVHERLLKLLRASGTVAGKGGKSLRILTAEFEALASFADSVSVDTAAAERARTALQKLGMPHAFSRIFRSEVHLSFRPQARDLMASLPSRVRLLLYRAQRITTLAPRLKVKRLKKARARRAA